MGATLAVRAAIKAVARGSEMALDEALATKAEIFGRLCATKDTREGTAAFLAKRQATWTGS